MDQLEVSVRQMEILRRGPEFFMTEQNLNGAQIGAGFEQMRGPTVAQCVRRNALANAGLLSGFTARQPYRLVGDGLFNVMTGS